MPATNRRRKSERWAPRTALAADERGHVLVLRSALQQAGVTPIAKPEINLNALGSAFENEAEFLTAARTLEHLDVSATPSAAGVPSVSGALLLVLSRALWLRKLSKRVISVCR